MPITSEQKRQAEEAQWTAARDEAPQVAVVAGPGTGKSHTIEKRVAHLLNNGVQADALAVISFTRATCSELKTRIVRFCVSQPCADRVNSVRISTMHSLALRILRQANLLASYPSTPVILDDWEQENVYDREFAAHFGCTPSRAAQIRLAYEAMWHTLDPNALSQARVIDREIAGFNAFHASRTNLYSCVLPGEVIHKCVEATQNGTLNLSEVLPIQHLIVDEYQDLNACDQEFVRRLCAGGAVLFVAGDDDQSIYLFRHANPMGIVRFGDVYPASTRHILTDCFRCTPIILDAATHLILHNQPYRIAKAHTALYGAASPPVRGAIHAWSFLTAEEEAKAIAQSCKALIDAGMNGHESEILILLCNRRVQLETLAREFGNCGLPYEQPHGRSIADLYKPIRAVYSLLRVMKENQSGDPDYAAYRDLLGVLDGVGDGTVQAVADACIRNARNYREIFRGDNATLPMPQRAQEAVRRTAAAANAACLWNPEDTVGTRREDVAQILQAHVSRRSQAIQEALGLWSALAGGLPQDMTLAELLLFLAADSETDQRGVLEGVTQRLGGGTQSVDSASPKKIRILTMHGAKGLSGKIVFIPCVEQGVVPNVKSLQATGLVMEQRRLFYVSLTRAVVCCIMTHSNLHTGAPAMALAQRGSVRLTRSQFLNEMGIRSENRSGGLTLQEATSIVEQVNVL